ncbi:MAG: SLBB domain-containing protein [Acidobacteria bacterium]|nr:SLBB domain-containing protein [Acidobacteriota bacterium]
MKYVFLSLLSVVFAGVVVSAQPPTQNLVPTPGPVTAQGPLDMSKALGYQIGPGDEITIKVVGEPDFDFAGRVDEDGRISIPFDDQPIDAKCKTERQLRSEMKLVLAKYLRNPQFNLRITDQNSRPPATVYGEVKTPQQVKLMRKASLVDLLAVSGGTTEEAAGVIQVFRTQMPICAEGDKDANWTNGSTDPTDVPSRSYSLADVRAGRESANPTIYPGDVIVVQKASPVYVTGEVNSSQGIYLKEGGTTLTEAIAKVGGVRQGAKTKDVKIYRLKANSKEREVIAANLDLIKTGKQKDVVLEPNDIIEVDKAKDPIGKTLLGILTGAGKTGIGSIANSIGYRVLY